MKRSKKLIVLAGVFAAVCIAIFALTRYEEKQEQIRTTGAVILAIPADSVERLSWTYTEGGLGFHKGESGWVYDEDEAFPVSEDKIRSILSNFEEFGASFIIENVEDYSQYGLDNPECTIHLGTADSTCSIRLGAYSKMDEERYVDIGDGNVYLVRNDPVDFLKSSLSGMIEHDDIPGFENVKDITFSGSENYRIVRTEDSPDSYSAEDVYFAELDGGNLPLDTDEVTNYLNTATGLELLTYATYNATEEELTRYGMDNPDLTVTVNYSRTDENGNEVSDTCVFCISSSPEEQKAYEAAVEAEKADLPDVTRYVRVGSSQIVYELDNLDYMKLSLASCDDLRHREVFWADFDRISRIDITLEGEEHTLTSSEGEKKDDKRVWHYGEKEVDAGRLQAALENLSADSFTDETPSEKEEISLTVYLDSGNFPQVRIQLYRYDGSLCLAVTDGKPVSLVGRRDVIDLVEAVQSIVLDKTQPGET